MPSRKPRRRNRGQGKKKGGFAGAVREISGAIGFPTVGNLIANGISRITGSGDYAISGLPKQNSLAGTTPPVFGTIGGVTRIRHREYIRDIYSSTGFAITRYNLNPGSSGLFPWLSQLAHNYEQYHIHGICLEFKSTSSNALSSTNTALGVVGMVTQYEANDPEFQNKQQLENYEGAQSCNPSCSMLHFVECKLGENVLDRLYVRSPGANIDDPRFFDLGEFSIMTQGMQQANVNIGELWVSYDVEFYKPKLNQVGNNDPSADMYYRNVFTPTNIENLGPSEAIVKPYVQILGTYIKTYGQGNGLGIYFPRTVPQGLYMVEVLVQSLSTPNLPTGVDFATYDGVTPIVDGYPLPQGYEFVCRGIDNLFFAAAVQSDGLTDGWCEFDVGWQTPTADCELQVAVYAITKYDLTYMAHALRKPLLTHKSFGKTGIKSISDID
jgi:hypothetical protein